MEKIKKVWLYYRKHGWKLTWHKVMFRAPPPADYPLWQKRHETSEEEFRIQRAYRPEKAVKISIAVPAFQTPENYLREMVESVRAQSYENWELCIADGSNDGKVMRVLEEYAQEDSRIRVKKLPENKGIAENTNAALAMCTGDYIGLLDHDDTLEASALYEVVRVIDREKADVIYTDEDKMSMDGQTYFAPHFKPDLNMELLCSNNYICHFFVGKAELVRKAGGFRKEFDGAQDYDFIFRCLRQAQEVRHIAVPLYHWRTHVHSTAENPQSKLFAYESGKRAIEDHLAQSGEKADVVMTEHPGFYHVKYCLKKKSWVTVVLVHAQGRRGSLQLRRCLRSLEKTAGYPYYNIRVVRDLRELQKENIRGEYLVLLDSTVTILKKGWLPEMLAAAQRTEAGAVGAKLYRRNERIYHAGIVQGMSGYAFEGAARVANGYFHRDSLMQEMSAVTKDFMLLSKEDYFAAVKESGVRPDDELGLCRYLREQGKKVIFNPELEAYTEKKTSGRVKSEQRDPYYNKNLSLDAPGFDFNIEVTE